MEHAGPVAVRGIVSYLMSKGEELQTMVNIETTRLGVRPAGLASGTLLGPANLKSHPPQKRTAAVLEPFVALQYTARDCSSFVSFKARVAEPPSELFEWTS